MFQYDEIFSKRFLTKLLISSLLTFVKVNLVFQYSLKLRFKAVVEIWIA